jgi:UDP-glucose 4-epimerase
VAENAGRRVLITGIATSLGYQLAKRLEADDDVAYVAGVDMREPTEGLERTEFIRADLRNPLIARVVDSTQADTLVHLSVIPTPGSAGGRSRMKELNVIGTMQLLAAAQRTPRVRKVVTRSTTAVYGSSYATPTLMREDQAPGVGGVGSGYSKDAIEVEDYARGFGRRRPDVTLTLLLFANSIGTVAEIQLTRYFNLPVVPTALGFDPRLQLCHEADAVEILHRACTEDHPGIYNIAGPGVMYLSQALRMAGKASVPIPSSALNTAGSLLRRGRRIDYSPEQLRFLLYGRVADIGRMRDGFAYEPAYSTVDAFTDFIESGRVLPAVSHDTIRELEQSLYNALSRTTNATPGVKEPT